MVDRHAGQEESAGLAAGDLHAVLADGHGLEAIAAAGGHRLEPPQQPDLHLQAVELLGRDGGETRIVAGGADGGMADRLAQRHRGTEETAAGAELPATLEADEAAIDGQFGDGAQRGGGGRVRPAARLHGGGHAPARRPKDLLLLLLGQDGAAAGARSAGAVRGRSGRCAPAGGGRPNRPADRPTGRQPPRCTSAQRPWRRRYSPTT